MKRLNKGEKGTGNGCIRQVGPRMDWEDWDWQEMEVKLVLRVLMPG